MTARSRGRSCASSSVIQTAKTPSTPNPCSANRRSIRVGRPRLRVDVGASLPARSTGRESASGRAVAVTTASHANTVCGPRNPVNHAPAISATMGPTCVTARLHPSRVPTRARSWTAYPSETSNSPAKESPHRIRATISAAGPVVSPYIAVDTIAASNAAMHSLRNPIRWLSLAIQPYANTRATRFADSNTPTQIRLTPKASA